MTIMLALRGPQPPLDEDRSLRLRGPEARSESRADFECGLRKRGLSAVFAGPYLAGRWLLTVPAPDPNPRNHSPRGNPSGDADEI